MVTDVSQGVDRTVTCDLQIGEGRRRRNEGRDLVGALLGGIDYNLFEAGERIRHVTVSDGVNRPPRPLGSPAP